MVAGADVVVFPVDCVDHDSVSMLKRVCQQQGVDYHPVRSASVASFVDLAVRLFGTQERVVNPQRADDAVGHDHA
ncbi:hypothetical protein D9M69_489800 [compost metagenome]